MDAPLLALLAGFTPQSSPPANPATNRVYLDDGSNTGTGNPGFMYWTGAAWADIGGSGSSVGVPEVVDQHVVSGSAATTVTFSSPGLYDQWTIVANAQAASSTGWVSLYFNGDTTANNYMRDINGTQQQNDPTCLIISTAGGFATINTQVGLDGRRHSRIENTYYDGSNATKHTLPFRIAEIESVKVAWVTPDSQYLCGGQARFTCPDTIYLPAMEVAIKQPDKLVMDQLLGEHLLAVAPAAAHELRHVQQFRDLGLFLFILLRIPVIRQITIEREAYAVEDSARQQLFDV